MFSSCIVLIPSLILLVSNVAAWSVNDVSTYFETPAKNLYDLNILPEYDLERHSFLSPSAHPTQEDAEEIDLIRMKGGPKSPQANGKRPALIQHGIFCNVDPCVINKPQIAIAYILVDQGYDVWLGKSNNSDTENMISTEDIEQERLKHVAQYILSVTQQTELSVMGYFNGSVKFFGMSAPEVKPEKQSKLSIWLEIIPGMKTVKRWYNNGKIIIKSGFNKIFNSVDYLGKKVYFITNDSSILNLQKTVMRAWGVVVTMVIPTLSIDDLSNMIDHPDVNLDTPDLIRKYNYEPETHQVKTEDGYILTMHRISGGNEYPAGPRKPVVLLQHGILSSSADWVVMGPSNSLGYILSDEGYDVWLGNSRGNSYSKSHVNISSSDTKFWDFSWHEMGMYDLPAMIDHILNVTGQEKIFYVGHSQGTTQFFVMLSEKPEYNDKIISMTGYAPIAYTGHMRSPIITLLASISTPFYYVLRLLGINNFLPTNALLTKIGREACEAHSVYQVVCSNTLFLMTGYDTAQMNKSMIPIILGHVPAGSSIKQFMHYGQEYNSKKFRQFDYKLSFMNKQEYGQSVPPDYNIKNIKVPVALFYGPNDLLTDPKDVERLAEELPNLSMCYNVPLDQFNHIDFLYAIDAPKLVYQPTIKYLRTSTTKV